MAPQATLVLLLLWQGNLQKGRRLSLSRGRPGRGWAGGVGGWGATVGALTVGAMLFFCSVLSCAMQCNRYGCCSMILLRVLEQGQKPLGTERGGDMVPSFYCAEYEERGQRTLRRILLAGGAGEMQKLYRGKYNCWGGGGGGG